MHRETVKKITKTNIERALRLQLVDHVDDLRSPMRAYLACSFACASAPPNGRFAAK